MAHTLHRGANQTAIACESVTQLRSRGTERPFIARRCSFDKLRATPLLLRLHRQRWRSISRRGSGEPKRRGATTSALSMQPSPLACRTPPQDSCVPVQVLPSQHLGQAEDVVGPISSVKNAGVPKPSSPASAKRKSFFSRDNASRAARPAPILWGHVDCVVTPQCMLFQSRQAIGLALIFFWPSPDLYALAYPIKLTLHHKFVMSLRLTRSVATKELFARSLFGAPFNAFSDVTTRIRPPA